MKLEIDLGDVLALSVDAFANWLESNLADGPVVCPLDLYNAFVRLAPQEAIGHAQAALSFFRLHGDETGELVFLELVARIQLESGCTEEAHVCIEQIMDLSSDDAQAVALELADDIAKAASDIVGSQDHLPRVLILSQMVYRRYEMKSELAELYLRAATLYSRHGATQAAYRCLADAEEIAGALNSLPLIAACFAAAVVVTCEEHDCETAISAARHALSAYRQAEIRPPPMLLSNLGVAFMSRERLWRAIICLQWALRAMDESDSLALLVRV